MVFFRRLLVRQAVHDILQHFLFPDGQMVIACFNVDILSSYFIGIYLAATGLTGDPSFFALNICSMRISGFVFFRIYPRSGFIESRIFFLPKNRKDHDDYSGFNFGIRRFDAAHPGKRIPSNDVGSCGS